MIVMILMIHVHVCVCVDGSSGMWITSCRWPRVAELATWTTCEPCAPSVIVKWPLNNTRTDPDVASSSRPPAAETSPHSFAQSSSPQDQSCWELQPSGVNAERHVTVQWQIQLWADRAAVPIDQNLRLVVAARSRLLHTLGQVFI